MLLPRGNGFLLAKLLLLVYHGLVGLLNAGRADPSCAEVTYVGVALRLLGFIDEELGEERAVGRAAVGGIVATVSIGRGGRGVAVEGLVGLPNGGPEREVLNNH